jgi:pilus assembly protein CpaD
MTDMTLSRLKSRMRIALPATLMLALGACVTDTTSYNRGMDSIRQPVVSYTSFVYDIGVGPDGGLSDSERDRLEGWLGSINIGYGDSVAIATESGDYGRAMHDGIASVIAGYSLLLGQDDSAQAGRAPEGAVRLIVRRALASVPGCPDWSIKDENTGMGQTSPNYGCGVNSNLAAMVANPADLVRGETNDSALRTATSNKAIQTYREKKPTGTGDLKNITPGGS